MDANFWHQKWERHYGETYQLELLAQTQIAVGFKREVDASIAAWLLQRRGR